VSANGQAAQAVEPYTPVAPTTTVQTPWRERANSELEKIVQLFSSKQLPDLCAKALINSPWEALLQVVLRQPAADAAGWNLGCEGVPAVERGGKVGIEGRESVLDPGTRQEEGQGKRKKALEEQGEPKEGFREVLIGFKAIPVFRFEDTYGQDLPVYEPKSPPPLMEVAERFGMRVQYERLAPGRLRRHRPHQQDHRPRH
jgi:hypothetical protein